MRNRNSVGKRLILSRYLALRLTSARLVMPALLLWVLSSLLFWVLLDKPKPHMTSAIRAGITRAAALDPEGTARVSLVGPALPGAGGEGSRLTSRMALSGPASASWALRGMASGVIPLQLLLLWFCAFPFILAEKEENLPVAMALARHGYPTGGPGFKVADWGATALMLALLVVGGCLPPHLWAYTQGVYHGAGLVTVILFFLVAGAGLGALSIHGALALAVTRGGATRLALAVVTGLWVIWQAPWAWSILG